jgi:hypothetical protein
MSPKKPVGQIGPYVVQSSQVGIAARWATVPFPENKAEIERKMVGYLEKAIAANGGIVLAVKQNDEANLDFTLNLPGGTVDLELREIHYLDGVGNPYISRNIRIQSSTYARQIFHAVQEKSAKYSAHSKVPMHLLLYITHWRFLPSEVVIRLVQHFLQQRPSIFENVILVLPIDDKEATVRVLYPSVEPLERRPPEEFSDHWYMNLDPASAEIHVEP